MFIIVYTDLLSKSTYKIHTTTCNLCQWLFNYW